MYGVISIGGVELLNRLIVKSGIPGYPVTSTWYPDNAKHEPSPVKPGELTSVSE